MANNNKKAECVRRVANWSKIEAKHRFDKKTYDKDATRKDIEIASPKLDVLFDTIKELDMRDMQENGHVYKHMIYSDVKTLGHGAKIIASSFIARGFQPSYGPDFQILEKDLAKKPYNSFAVLCSTPVYDRPITVKLKQSILQKYNERPTNIHGKNIRFLILDQGYKEGIDVFDIKYIHLFEPTITKADERQAIGRGTRMCGQKGLKFHHERGWPLHVYKYNSILTDDDVFLYQNTTHDLFLKLSGLNPNMITLANELDKICIIGAVDHSLTKNIHSFEIAGKKNIYQLPKNIEEEIARREEERIARSKAAEPKPVPAPIEKFIFYGREYYGKGKSIICKDGCRGTIPIPTVVMLIAWMMSMKDRLPLYIRRPRSFLCQAIIDNKQFCNTLNLIWKKPEYFISTYKNDIRFMISVLSKEKNIHMDHINAMSAYVTEELKKIKEPPAPPAPLHTPPSTQLSFAGMRNYIQKEFGDYTWGKIEISNSCSATARGGAASTIVDFTPTQNFVKDYFQPSNPYKGMLLHHSTGSGKCHAKDTPILMYDGTIKMVQDVKVGDLLMGDDSTPRKVLSLADGYDDMYDVIPVKGNKYTVNSEHILCLKPTRHSIVKLKNNSYSVRYCQSNGKITSRQFKTKEEAIAFDDGISTNKPVIEIAIKDYIKLSQTSKHTLKGYRVGIDFEEKKLPIDPQLFGIWLGDGGSRDPKITTADPEILEFVRKKIEPMGLRLNHETKYDYRISTNGKPGLNSNAFYNFMKKYNLVNNKHIPHVFLANSRENRLKLLAGLIDTDGHFSKGGYEITQKSDKIADGILFLARSLGFAAYSKKCKKGCMYKGEMKDGMYNRVYISGDISEIPVILPHKKADERKQKKDVLVTGIDVKHVGRGKYYGFILDGNHRYLMGDFTVTHNTCSAIATATNSFEKEGYTILWVTRHTLKSDIWKNMFNQVCSIVLQEQIKEGLNLPDELVKRKKLLSKNWIEPISYKQFSNFLKGKNKALTEIIIERNGKEDPLKKTLVIIDEAHKLYAPDVSASERPDVDILKKMIHSSYSKSGKDSVRLLLMTATPYTADPIDLIKLINFLKKENEQFPETFDKFKDIYLDGSGMFSMEGTIRFLNEISGHISYLNRENDIRQFAYPIIHDVEVPISTTPGNMLYRDIQGIQDEIIDYKHQLDHEIPLTTRMLKDDHNRNKKACDDLLDKKEKAQCKKEEIQRHKGAMEIIKRQKGDLKEQAKISKQRLKETKKKLVEAEKRDISQETILKSECFGIERKMLSHS